jgi:excisionase family DNA binding protein
MVDQHERAHTPSPLLTLRESTAYLKLSIAYLYTLIAKQRLAVVKVGKRTLIARTELDAFIARHTKPASTVKPRKPGRPPKFPNRRKITDERRAAAS